MLTDEEKAAYARAQERTVTKSTAAVIGDLLDIIDRLQRSDVVLAEAERLWADRAVVELSRYDTDVNGAFYSECPDDSRWSVKVMDRDNGEPSDVDGLHKSWPEAYAALVAEKGGDGT